MLSSFKKSSYKILYPQIRRLNLKPDNTKVTIKYDFTENPTEETFNKFQQENFPTHWVHKHLPRPDIWLASGEQTKVFDFDKDAELGRYVWNSNGCYPNRLANLLYRSPA